MNRRIVKSGLIIAGLIAVMLFTGCPGGGGGGNGGGNGGGDYGSATLQVGDISVVFTSAGGGVVPGTDTLGMMFLPIQTGFPFAEVFIDDISSVQPGVPVEADTVAFMLDTTTSVFEDDDDNPCYVTFTTLNMTSGGRLVGTINGTLLGDMDDDWNLETYPLSCSFNAIYIDESQY